ncbi:MAG TPA: hypothetical protein VF753_21805, partial [Terriglobales bacterium]
MKVSKVLLLSAMILGFVVAGVAAHAPTINVTYSLVRVHSALTTAVGGINDSGTVVGVFQEKAAYQHGYVMSNGKATWIDYPNAQT